MKSLEHMVGIGFCPSTTFTPELYPILDFLPGLATHLSDRFMETEVGNWVQVALVMTQKDGGQVVEMFRNGESMGTSKIELPIMFSTASIEVLFGWHPDLIEGHGSWIRCQIDEARIYNRALSQDELKALTPIKTAPPGSNEWWWLLALSTILLMFVGRLILRKRLKPKREPGKH